MSQRLKEEYRKKTFWGLDGKQKPVSLADLDKFCQELNKKIDKSLNYLKKRYFILPTYFKSDKAYKKGEKYKISLKPLPPFLESIVHYLKICSLAEAKSIYHKVKQSPLFDRKLKMYRLNASLKDEPLSIGRIRVFNAGWLENESIWLHMEYKYLLELLKSGLYQEFYREFYNAGVCFQAPHVYGRSTWENSSFIVSSAYIDKSLWGKGFVARLSGSTAELMNIFMIMVLGKEPFFVKAGKLYLKFSPLLHKSLFSRKQEKLTIGGINGKAQEAIIPANSFCFRLFSTTLVCYHNPSRRNTFDKDARIERIEIEYKNKTKKTIAGGIISAPDSLYIRERQAQIINVFIR